MLKQRHPTVFTIAEGTFEDSWRKTRPGIWGGEIRPGAGFPEADLGAAGARVLPLPTTASRFDVLTDHNPTTIPNYTRLLTYWDTALGHLRLSDLTASKIAGCRDDLATLPMVGKSPESAPARRTPTTVRRYLATLAAVFSACQKQWHWLADSPMRQVIVSRVRPLLADRLIAYRQGKVADLTGSGLVFPSRVSLNQPAQLRKPFETAPARAGIEGFVWHDLRHSAASFMAANGASLLEIGPVLGRKCAQPTSRYAHLTDQTSHALVRGTADKLLGSR